jgi:hypothetical protein
LPTLTLHFETAPDADASALAAKLQSGLASLPEVEKAGAQALANRDITVAASAIMGFLTVAPVVINHAAELVNSVKNLIESCEGLHNAIVEIRGRRIPIDKLQPSDLAPATPQT